MVPDDEGMNTWRYPGIMCGVQRCCRSTLDQASTEEFWSGRLQRESDNIDSWLLNRQGLGKYEGGLSPD